MYDQIHWQDGGLLTAKHLNMHEEMQQNNILNSITLPYYMPYGIIQFHLDEELLAIGTIKIKNLKCYTKANRLIHISIEDNILFSLDEYNENTNISIYLNLNEKVTSHQDVDTLSIRPSLSDHFLEDKLESMKLFEVYHTGNQWNINTYSNPLLSCDSCTFTPILIQIEKILITLKHFIESIQKENQYFTLNIHYHELKRMYTIAKKSPIHINPYEIFKKIDNLYFIISLIKDKQHRCTDFDFNHPNKAFLSLFNHFFELLNKPVKKQFVTFEREGEYYLINELDNDFINASEYILIIRQRTDNASKINIDYLKLSSIKHNKHINQMSLPGVQLEKLPQNGIHNFDNSTYHETYRIGHGKELDEILLERNIMFQHIDNADHYQFLIYYR
ncbi:type VI secretion system baseplate subunit TssK [uncultured Shewanella sp.]|uniref:type VI secretion system baseplate subunit TssK n=1 Tax=uncultured Shewanella sp. TaxID=173975 RepID=UPI002631870F|nr:type VI secretion system baseplate subunit TssK [uncultured Shewanella sp.]